MKLWMMKPKFVLSHDLLLVHHKYLSVCFFKFTLPPTFKCLAIYATGTYVVSCFYIPILRILLRSQELQGQRQHQLLFSSNLFLKKITLYSDHIQQLFISTIATGNITRSIFHPHSVVTISCKGRKGLVLDSCRNYTQYEIENYRYIDF